MPARVLRSSPVVDIAIVRAEHAEAGSEHRCRWVRRTPRVRPGSDCDWAGARRAAEHRHARHRQRGAERQRRHPDPDRRGHQSRQQRRAADRSVRPGHRDHHAQIVSTSGSNSESLGFAVAIDHARPLLEGRPAELVGAPAGGPRRSGPLSGAFAPARSQTDTDARRRVPRSTIARCSRCARRADSLDDYWNRFRTRAARPGRSRAATASGSRSGIGRPRSIYGDGQCTQWRRRSRSSPTASARRWHRPTKRRAPPRSIQACGASCAGNTSSIGMGGTGESESLIPDPESLIAESRTRIPIRIPIRIHRQLFHDNRIRPGSVPRLRTIGISVGRLSSRRKTACRARRRTRAVVVSVKILHQPCIDQRRRRRAAADRRDAADAALAPQVLEPGRADPSRHGDELHERPARGGLFEPRAAAGSGEDEHGHVRHVEHQTSFEIDASRFRSRQSAPDGAEARAPPGARRAAGCQTEKNTSSPSAVFRAGQHGVGRDPRQPLVNQMLVDRARRPDPPDCPRPCSRRATARTPATPAAASHRRSHESGNMEQDRRSSRGSIAFPMPIHLERR